MSRSTEEHGRIHVSSRVDAPPGKLRGQDLDLVLVDAYGVRHRLPAKDIVIRCDSREEYVVAEVTLMVSKIDLDLMAVFFRDDNLSRVLEE